MKKILATALVCVGMSVASVGFAAGDAERGKKLYGTCASCHGMAGEGVQAMGAPKLAGQEGWYMERQIKNYQNGIRGSHPDDTWGKMMAPMALMLRSDQDIADVIAYIETL